MSSSTLLRHLGAEVAGHLRRSPLAAELGLDLDRLTVDAVLPRRIASFRAQIEPAAGGEAGAGDLAGARDLLAALPWVRTAVHVPPRLYFDVDPAWLAERLDVELAPDRGFGYLPSPEAAAGINLAYCSPNANKPLHLGHARNMLLGTAVGNLLALTGVPVYRSICLSDYGVHLFKALSAYLWCGENADPAAAGEKGDHFVGRFYARFGADPDEIGAGAGNPQDLARLWAEGSEEVRELTRRLAGWAEQGFRETFAEWGVEFDHWFYETEEQAYIDEFVARQRAAGAIRLDDEGRLVADLASDPASDLASDPPASVVLARSDGTPLYMSHMVAAILQRLDRFGACADTLMALTGEEQVSPFAQLDAILERFGYARGVRVVHLTYGLVTSKGQRLSSREGTALTLDGTVDELAGRCRGARGPLEPRERARSALALHLLGRSREKALAFSADACWADGTKALDAIVRALEIVRERPSDPPAAAGFPARAAADRFEQWLTRLAAYPLVLDRAVRRLDPAPLVHWAVEQARELAALHSACGDWAAAPRPLWRAAAPAGRAIEHALGVLNLRLAAALAAGSGAVAAGPPIGVPA